MEEKLLLKDVNLDNVSFLNNGTSLRFDFINMNDGESYATIICKEVCLFRYDNAFESEGDAFPCYIIEVTVNRVNNENIDRVLNELQWNFELSDQYHSQFFSTENHLISINSGEVHILVLCNGYDFQVNEL